MKYNFINESFFESEAEIQPKFMKYNIQVKLLATLL